MLDAKAHDEIAHEQFIAGIRDSQVCSKVRDAAPEYRPLSQLLLVTELDTSHKRQSPVYKRGTVCLLD